MLLFLKKAVTAAPMITPIIDDKNTHFATLKKIAVCSVICFCIIGFSALYYIKEIITQI
jgi:hypothetical protein